MGAVSDLAFDAAASAHRRDSSVLYRMCGRRKRKTSERGPNEKSKSRRRSRGERVAKTANLLFVQ
jgi:hypothetical protein